MLGRLGCSPAVYLPLSGSFFNFAVTQLWSRPVKIQIANYLAGGVRRE